jgi:hypothetical protein
LRHLRRPAEGLGAAGVIVANSIDLEQRVQTGVATDARRG